MPPKKLKKSTKKGAAQPDHPAWKDMIAQGIQQLKERHGSSRPALKKFIASNFKVKPDTLDVQFNMALRRGVAQGLFVYPKGPSGAVKLSKKEPSGSTEKKPVTEKKQIPKTTPTRKSAAKPSTTTKTTESKKHVRERTKTKKAGVVHKKTPSTSIVRARSARVSKPATPAGKKKVTSAKKSPRKSPRKI